MADPIMTSKYRVETLSADAAVNYAQAILAAYQKYGVKKDAMALVKRPSQ